MYCGEMILLTSISDVKRCSYYQWEHMEKILTCFSFLTSTDVPKIATLLPNTGAIVVDICRFYVFTLISLISLDSLT